MDDTEDLYFQKIDEFINDEDKIITSTWLSATLQIPLAQAKDLLKNYVKDMKKHAPIHMTYTIMGLLQEDCGFGVVLAKSADLEEKRQQFKSIACEDIYSIQKHEELDLNALTLIEPLNVIADTKSRVQGLVVGPNCVKRQIINKQKATPNGNPVKNDVKPATTSINGKEQQAENTSRNNNTKKKPSNIQNMFAAAANGIPAKKAKLEESIPVKKDIASVKEKENKNLSNVVQEKSKKPAATKVSSSSSSTGQQHKKRQRKTNIQESSKKRRRIVEVIDSDDDIFSSAEEAAEDVIENSDCDDEQPVLKFEPEPKEVCLKRGKVTKTVTSTYNDDDGFIVTKREKIQVSDTEEDPEPPIKEPKTITNGAVSGQIKETAKKQEVVDAQPGKRGRPGKKAKPTTGKQQTLISFFSKK